jgi:hypothetical protein
MATPTTAAAAAMAPTTKVAPTADENAHFPLPGLLGRMLPTSFLTLVTDCGH